MRLLTLILIFISFWSYGQPVPCFTLSDSSGCVGENFTVTSCTAFPSPQYFYDYANNPTIFTTSTNHTYNDPGIYEVRQAVFDGQTPIYQIKFITIKSKPIPKFEIALCNNYGVQIVIPDSGYTEYIVNWGDGSANDTYVGLAIAQHTYPNNTPRTITINGKHQPENCGESYQASTTPVQTILKANTDILEVIDKDTIILTITGQKNVVYNINLLNSSGGLINTHTINAPFNNFSDTLTGLNTTTTTYCVEITSTNACTNSIVATSDKVCSVVLSASSLEGFNEINWDIYKGDNTVNYELKRNDLSPFPLFTTNQNPYTDSSIFCSRRYNYQLYTSTNAPNNNLSISNIATVIGQSEKSPNPVTNVFSTYNEANELIISWKSTSKISPKFHTINEFEATDTFIVINSFERKCYDVTYTDSCDNTSQVSEQTCPIVLEAVQNSIFEIGLNWNDYQSFANGVNRYELKIYDLSNTLLLTENVDLLNDYLFDVSNETNQIYYFRITGFSNDSLTTLSNEVELKLENRIAIPNAFSPNGDGQNDIFIPKVRFVKDIKISIYNKWGANMFTSTDINQGWGGGNFPSGIYTYVIEITDYLDITDIKRGTVTLIR